MSTEAQTWENSLALTQFYHNFKPDIELGGVLLASLLLLTLLGYQDFQEMWKYRFMRRAIYAGILAALAFGIIGSYVVVRRLVFITGGIAHASFGGVGLAFYLSWGLVYGPIMGAALFALASALGIGLLSRETLEREETTIGIIWAVGMALGAFFIRETPGYSFSPSSYLFGDILLLGEVDILFLQLLIGAILVTVFLLYHKLQALAFDEEFTMVVGVHTTLLNLYFLGLVAMTIVLLLKFMGVILVLAMLTIPASIMGQFTSDLKRIMGWSTLLSLIFVLGGLWTAWVYDTEVGATIVLQSAAVYLGVTLGKKVWEFVRMRRRRQTQTETTG